MTSSHAGEQAAVNIDKTNQNLALGHEITDNLSVIHLCQHFGSQHTG